MSCLGFLLPEARVSQGCHSATGVLSLWIGLHAAMCGPPHPFGAFGKGWGGCLSISVWFLVGISRHCESNFESSCNNMLSFYRAGKLLASGLLWFGMRSSMHLVSSRWQQRHNRKVEVEARLLSRIAQTVRNFNWTRGTKEGKETMIEKGLNPSRWPSLII